MDKIKIVFVCLGNYCRSPMAEAIFKKMAQLEGILDRFDVSSAGTKDWDIGSRPDYRTQQILEAHGYPLDPDKRAKKITQADLETADYLVVMSKRVADELGNRNNVFPLMSFVDNPETLDVPDPYPGDTFPQAFNLIEQGTKAFYAHIKAEIPPVK